MPLGAAPRCASLVLIVLCVVCVVCGVLHVQTPRTVAAVLPQDSAAEAVSVDGALSFLNSYVEAALKHGAQPYQNKDRRDALEAEREAKLNNRKDEV